MSLLTPMEIGHELLFERRGRIAIATLNRPQARNAVNGAIARALDWVVKSSEADPGIHCVILASSHTAVFCAGADLLEVSRGNAEALSTPDGGFAGIVKARRKKPWIAAVDGAAFGGGCEIALSCDMIVASDNSGFALPEVKRGLFAGAGGLYRLPRALPRNVALELIATGDPISGARAYALGLANRHAAVGEVLAAAIDLATSIAANAPLSVSESLSVARSVYDLAESQLEALCSERSAIVFSSDDAKEGPRAFLEKRPPNWTGLSGFPCVGGRLNITPPRP